MNPYPREYPHDQSFSGNGYLHTWPPNLDMYHTRTHQPLQYIDGGQYLYKRTVVVDGDRVLVIDGMYPVWYPPPPLPFMNHQQRSGSSSFSTPTHDQDQPRPFIDRGHHQHSDFIDEVVVLENLDMDSSSPHGGLTKEVISKNLKLKQIDTCHGEEGDEVCVICQDGFERKETVGVLECEHRYHVECIKEWLFRKNVCPLCKAQAFTL